MHACMHCAVRKQSQQQQHAKQCAGQVYGGVKCILSRDLLIPPAISFFFLYLFFSCSIVTENIMNGWCLLASGKRDRKKNLCPAVLRAEKKTPR